MMLKVKSCPKCHGDLVVDRDSYGLYEQCIQCGYTHDIVIDVSVKPEEQSHRGVKKAKGGARLFKSGVSDK